MKIKFLFTLIAGAMMLLSSTGYSAQYYFTRGMQDSYNDRTSANAKNWAPYSNSNKIPNDYVNYQGYSLEESTALPTKKDYVILNWFSGYNGEYFEDGVTNVITFNANNANGTEAGIGQINQRTEGTFSGIDNSKAVKYIRTASSDITLTFEGADSILLLKTNNNETELHLQANASVVSGQKVAGFRNRTAKDLVIGAVDKEYTFKFNGAAYDYIDTYLDLKLSSSGNIVIYSQLLGNIGKKLSTDASLNQYRGIDVNVGQEAGYTASTGAVIFAGTKSNQIELLDISGSTTVTLQMRNGVTFNMGNSEHSYYVGGNQLFYETNNRIRLSQDSKLSVEGDNQIEASTDLIFRVADATTSAGTVLLNNNDIAIENINYEFEGNTSNKLTAIIDFGEEKGIANNIEISGSILTSILSDSSDNKIESIDFANTELIIKNFDKEAGDLIYVLGGSIDDNILSTISFDGLGEKGIDYEVVYDGMNLGYNLIPEPSSYALFFGVLALGYVIRRRK